MNIIKESKILFAGIQDLGLIKAIGIESSQIFSNLASTIGISTTALGGFIAGAAGLIIIPSIIDAITTTVKESREALSNMQSSYDENKSELESLNSELATTQSRMDELQAKGHLTLTEQEELANLQAQNAELERTIALKEAQQKIDAIQLAKQAQETYNKYTQAQDLFNRNLGDTEYNRQSVQSYKNNISTMPLAYGSQDRIDAIKKNAIKGFWDGVVNEGASLNDLNIKDGAENINYLIGTYEALQEAQKNVGIELDNISVKGNKATEDELKQADALQSYYDALEKKSVDVQSYMNDYADSISNVYSAYKEAESQGVITPEQTAQLKSIESFMTDYMKTVTNTAGNIEAAINNIFAKSQFINLKDKLVEAGKSGEEVLSGVIAKTPGLSDALDKAGVSAQQLTDHIMAIADPDSLRIDVIKDQLRKAFTEEKYEIHFKAGETADVLFNDFIKDKSDEEIEIFFKYKNANDLDMSDWTLDDLTANWTKAMEQVATDTSETASRIFQTLFKDSEGKKTDFGNQIDTFKENISSLTEARNTLLSGETVNMTELFSNFPELTQQSGDLLDAINKLKNQNLADILSNSYDKMSTFNNPQDIASMKKYLVGVIKDSASELSESDLQQVQSMFVNSIVLSSAGTLDRQEASQWIKSLFEDATKNVSPLQKLSNEMTVLQSEAKKVQDAMSLKDALGIKEAKSDYRDLINNSRDQVNNLQLQNEELQRSLVGLSENSDSYRTITSQIESNVSAINEARIAQIEWNKAAKELDYQPNEGLMAYNKAKQSRNAGDNYLDMLNAAKEAQEARKKGLVGTDDFKSVAKMFSPNGMDDYANWDENYGKIKRYFTEDVSGVKNFLEDLKGKTNDAGEALASFDESTKTWTYNIDDIQGSADELGISFESFLAVMGRLQDYGFSNNFFSSVEDGQERIADLYVELSDAQAKLKQLETDKSNGDTTVTDTVLSQQESRVNQIKQSILESQDLLNQLVNKSADDYEKEYVGKVSSLTQRLSEANNIDDEGARKSYIQKIKEWAESEAININDLFTADGNVNQEVLSKLQEQYKIDITPSTEYLDGASKEISDSLKSAYEDSDSDIRKSIDSLSGYTQEQLSNITFGDGITDEALPEAESAIDKILASLGLGQEYASSIIQILAELGYIEPVKLEPDTTELDEAIQEAEKPTEKEVKLKVEKAEEESSTFGIVGKMEMPTMEEMSVKVNAENPSAPVEQVQSAADSNPVTVETTTVDNSGNPENKKATVDYDKGDQANPDDKEADVNYKLGTQELPETKMAKVNYILGTQALPQEKTVKVHYDTSGAPKDGEASGTLMIAKATGTAYNMLNLRAHAYGTDVSIKRDEVALVNELGNEAIIRDGKLYEIPGGTHMQSLKRGDVVINAAQWAEIKKYGSTNTFAGKAYATGTFGQIPLAHAYANNGGTFAISTSSTPTTPNNQYANSLDTVTKSAKKASTATNKLTKSFNAFKKWTEKLVDWVEVKINRQQENIDLNLAQAENKIGYSKKNDSVSKAQATQKLLIATNAVGEKKYLEQANAVKANAVNAKMLNGKTKSARNKRAEDLINKIQNGSIDINQYGEKEREFINQYTEWYDKAIACRQAVEELKTSQRELAQTKLDNITDQYEAFLSHLEHQADLINGFIDQSEMKGYVESAKYYEVLMTNTMSQRTNLEKERAALIASLQESMNSGVIQKNSVEWANMQSQINDVSKAIQDADSNLLEFSNKIREIQWARFDMGQEAISRITDETEFLIKLMSNDDLFDDKGNTTEQGMATFGLYGVNYNTYMEQAQQYRDEMLKINSQIAKDPNNTTLLKRREELIDLQRDSILAAEEEKQAIKDLVKDGIDKQLSSLQELID